MYERTQHGWLKHLDFMILDLLCLEVSLLISYVTRQKSINMYTDDLYLNLALVMVFINLSVSVLCESFEGILKRGYYKEFTATFQHVVIVMMITVLYLFVTKNGNSFSRSIYFLTGILYGTFSYIMRLLWKRYLAKSRRGEEGRSMMVITVSYKLDSILKNLRESKFEKFNITGLILLDKDMTGEEVGGIPVVASGETAAEYICREWVDEVFLDLPVKEPYPNWLLDELMEMGITIHMTLDKIEQISGQKQFVERIGNYSVLTTSINYASPLQFFLKRAIDIAGGLVGCFLTGVIFIFIAPAIYIQSPGPIFFSQVRVGRNGKKFKIYKFRSMYMDAEERKKEMMAENTIKDGMMFKIPFDPRIIGSKKLPDGTCKKGIGNFIRNYSLDEFPQFFNILKGDMSLVGTRPPTVDEWEKYDYHHRVRLAIKPGLTGMWQVSGRSNITDFEEVVKLDKQYIMEWSLGLDIKILLKTVGVVLKKDGSM